VQAQGSRLEWQDVPDAVRREVAILLGSPVVEAVNQPGGFSPGVAARCQLEDGRRCFIKTVSPAQNPIAPDLHRREAQIAAALPADLPAPRLLGVIDDGDWITLVFEEIVGEPPPQPWSLDALAATFRSLDQLAARTTPCPIPGLSSFAERHASTFDGYRRIASGEVPMERLDPWTSVHLARLVGLEERWEDAVVGGSSLVHSDLRADNLLVTTDGEVVIVDWPHACVGPAWVDKLFMLPSVPLDGGPSPEEVEAELKPFRGVDADDVNLVLVALCGYFTHRGLQPDPIGLPTVRAFQRAQGLVARQWISARLGLA